MGMRVTCRYCKSKIEKKDALQIPGEKYNTYYCNQECYSNYFAEKEKTKNENEAVEIKTVTFDSNGRVKEINCKRGKSLYSHCEIVSGIRISSQYSSLYMFEVAASLGYLYDWEYVDYNGSAGKKVSYERLGLELTFVDDVLVEANKTQANPSFEEWYADYKPSFTLWHYVKTKFVR